jgi:hypothetical protein
VSMATIGVEIETANTPKTAIYLSSFGLKL